MKKNLKSKTVHTSKRSYFFNLFELSNGETMLSITESKKTSATEYQRSEIKIFKDDIEKFLKFTKDFSEEL